MISHAELEEMQRRLAVNSGMKPLRAAVSVSGVQIKEAALHDAIIDECNRRGWLYFHGSMAHRTRRTVGEPDFVILANVPDATRDSVIPTAKKPVVFLIECKGTNTKLSVDQLSLHAWAAKLGHTIHVVRTVEEFLQVLQ